jgi:CheY-like chemotaxis protein
MPKTVLVVEDVEDISKILSLRLKMHGYSCVIAPGGREGLARTREEKPDLILLDIRMPDFNGFDFLNAVFADDEICHIPVIVCTASAEADTEARCLEMGAKFYITKPFDHMYLRTCIDSCIGPPEGER